MPDNQPNSNKNKQPSEQIQTASVKQSPVKNDSPSDNNQASPPSPPEESQPQQEDKGKNFKKFALLAIAGVFLLASIAGGVLLVKRRQTIAPSAQRAGSKSTNITADDTGKYGVRTTDSGTKAGSNAYCCVTENQITIDSPSTPEGFRGVSSIAIESHDHTADVAYNLEAYNQDDGWTTVATDVDVSTANSQSCNEDSNIYPDHGYPDNPNTATHDDSDCYVEQAHSLNCQEAEKIRLKFHSAQGDDEHDVGEHIHLRNITWEFCPEEEPPSSGNLICMPVDDNGNITNDKYKYDRMLIKNETGQEVQVKIQTNLCPYQGEDPQPGYECNDYNEAYPYKISAGQQVIVPNSDTATWSPSFPPDWIPCQNIGQLDVQKDKDHYGDNADAIPDCYNTIDERVWEGGVAFTIKANPCEVPSLECSSLTLTDQNRNLNQDDNVYTGAKVGDTITVAHQATEKGGTGWAKVDSVGDPMTASLESYQGWAAKDSGSNEITLEEAGNYVFSTNAFSNDCQYACSSGGIYYQSNGCGGCYDYCDDPYGDDESQVHSAFEYPEDHLKKYSSSEFCRNDCLTYLVVEEAEEPTPPPEGKDVTIEGYKKDSDTNEGLEGAEFSVQKVLKTSRSVNACSGERTSCDNAQITTDTNGFFTVTCQDVIVGSEIGDATGILIQEINNPEGYTDGNENPVNTSGCVAWDVDTACCPLEEATNTYSATFYNKMAESYACNCTRIKIYDENKDIIPQNQYNALQPGQLIYFGVIAYNGYPNPDYNVARARVRVNRSAWRESDITTEIKSESNEEIEFIKSYVIPEGTTDFKVEAEVYLDAPGDIGGWR